MIGVALIGEVATRLFEKAVFVTYVEFAVVLHWGAGHSEVNVNVLAIELVECTLSIAVI